MCMGNEIHEKHLWLNNGIASLRGRCCNFRHLINVLWKSGKLKPRQIMLGILLYPKSNSVKPIQFCQTVNSTQHSVSYPQPQLFHVWIFFFCVCKELWITICFTTVLILCLCSSNFPHHKWYESPLHFYTQTCSYLAVSLKNQFIKNFITVRKHLSSLVLKAINKNVYVFSLCFITPTIVQEQLTYSKKFVLKSTVLFSTPT